MSQRLIIFSAIENDKAHVSCNVIPFKLKPSLFMRLHFEVKTVINFEESRHNYY